MLFGRNKPKLKGTLVNLAIIAMVGLVLWFILDAGKALQTGREDGGPVLSNSGLSSVFDFRNVINLHHPLSILILQILIIILASRILGWIMSLINQPMVIGEILAGIMLGPSLLGMYFPEVMSFVFPVESLGNLQILSQIGLILFMFIVGMELDIGALKQRASAALFISNTSIVVPFVLGAGLAYFLYGSFAPEGAGFVPFALFMGISISITAFPLLARILQERGLTRTPVGMTAITCAATNDITAWSILALIVAVASSGALIGVLITVLLSMIFVSVMLFVIRPFLNKVALKHTARETVSTTIVAMVLSTMLISSYITEVIGIHALFGAFIAGVIIPDNARFKQIIAEKIQDVSMVLLLPLFFVYTGLRTQIGLLNEPELWLTVLLVIGFAVAGKFAGSALAARLTGQSWKDSFLLGALLNTRGLFELVALNIGYDMGVLSPEIFTILVLMALATAFMTGPFISLINYLSREPEIEQSVFGLLKVLVAFGPPESGGRLTLMVNSLFANRKNNLKITALHLTPNTEITIEDARHFEDEAFRIVREVATDAGIEVKTIYRTTENVSMEIVKAANRGKFDLLIVGSSRPLLSQDETGGKARYFFDKAKCDVGLFIDKGFEKICNILIITESDEESYLHELAKGFNPDCHIDSACMLPVAVPVKGVEMPAIHNVLLNQAEEKLSSYDLIISTINCYRDQREAGALWVDGKASILLISQKDNR